MVDSSSGFTTSELVRFFRNRDSQFLCAYLIGVDVDSVLVDVILIQYSIFNANAGELVTQVR